ncbi:MAG: hypothetical protein FD157_2904 [Rhodocyclaceae bacterium]|nr:MAG: hypothetical protein FD157_2904 [Rhodocyclaceae bacterium]TND03845.1 MAG: hypothetical protein FD118_1263 [Rhodocyclaceae bacterium]
MDMENDIRYEIAIWLTGQNPWIHQQRESLANAYPFLAPALTKPSNKTVDAAIMAAIQRRERPDETLPELLGISRAAASLLKDADVEILGEGWCRHPVELLRALNIVDPTARPRTHYDWAVFHRYWMIVGLHQCPAYLAPVPNSHRRMFVLEHLFRGLCLIGYQPQCHGLANRLVSGQEGFPGLQFIDYVIFIESCLVDVAYGLQTFKAEDREYFIEPIGSGPTRAEYLLMRYLAEEQVRQWEVWRGLMVVQKCSAPTVPPLPNPKDILRKVLPDFDEAVRWIKQYPVSIGGG